MSDQKAIEYNSESTHAIQQLMANYENLAHSLVDQLQFSVPNHGLTTGINREIVWMDIFERIIPSKFCIDQGVFIIDSHGNLSREVDIAIFDEMYTPYIFRFGKIKMIPIEAVAVAVQCKSTDIEDANIWAESISSLNTSLDSCVRIMTGLIDNENIVNNKIKSPCLTQTSTRPIMILCALNKRESSFTKVKNFDIFLYTETTDNNSFELRKYVPHYKDDYECWYKILNHHDKKLEDYIQDSTNKKPNAYDGENHGRTLSDLQIPRQGEENVILSLMFQLNQLLMLINNPMQFPHRAYADMFNHYMGIDGTKEDAKSGDN